MGCIPSYNCTIALESRISVPNQGVKVVPTLGIARGFSKKPFKVTLISTFGVPISTMYFEGSWFVSFPKTRWQLYLIKD